MLLRKPELGTPPGRLRLALPLYDNERRPPPADADEATRVVADHGDPLIVGQLYANHFQRLPEQGSSTGTCPVREDQRTGPLPVTSGQLGCLELHVWGRPQ